MRTVTSSELDWLNTFPHLVAPLPDELFPGLLLRCDEANGWLAGTTATMVVLPKVRKDVGWAQRQVLAESFDLSKLADFLAIPLSDLLKTTFRPVLQRLYGKPDVYPHWLSESQVIRICPACIGETRLISTFHALHKVGYCPVHQFVLLDQCSCGAYLFTALNATPFTCYQCREDWANLPHIPITPERLAIEEHYQSLYRFFLTEATWLDFRRTLYWLREEGMRLPRQDDLLDFFLGLRWDFWDWDSLGIQIEVNRYERWKPLAPVGFRSLAEVIEKLVELEVSVREVTLNARPQPRHEHSCLNRACPLFGLTEEGNIAFYGNYHIPLGDIAPIWYCNVCGSCYVDHRLCLTFDEDCTTDNPSILYPRPRSIYIAQTWLRERKSKLERVCRGKLMRGQEIELRQVFDKAGIPWRPNLLAPRLGLVQIVKEYTLRQQQRKL